MRGTVAKRLRRQAEAETTGAPARQLMQHKKTGVALHGPHSTRAVYRKLKVAYMKESAK